MSQHHQHSHGHNHHVPGHNNQRRVALTLVSTSIYMFAEIIGGFYSNSLALLADAGHMLSDVAALALSLFALWITKKPATPRQSFGYYRVEILAALVNAVTLVGVSLYIFYEAIERLQQPEEIQAPIMILIAVGGLLVNLFGLALLHKGRSDSLNIKGAWLHVLTDTLGSIGVVISGFFVWAFGWTIFDPIASIVISALVVFSAWSLIKETVSVLMESAPGHIDPDAVREAILKVDGVGEIHDLHVWSITSGMESLSCHVVAQPDFDHLELLYKLRCLLSKDFKLNHVTLQIENEGFEEEVHWRCQN